MSDSGKAVFLSYASQDAEAAKRICEALRAAGVEVWFDQNELVGGDAWDAKIRGQIGSCALFVPVISANTQARLEGYFRLEWKLAAQRTHTMADEKAFLLPIVIDDTRDAEAKVPVEFKSVQWTKLPGGETPAKFCARVKKLLGGEAAGVTLPPGGPAESGRKAPAPTPSRPWLMPALVGVAALGTVALWQPWKKSVAPGAAAVGGKAAALTPAQELVAKARTILDQNDEMNREGYALAEELLQKAELLDPTDASAWALHANLSVNLFWFGFDITPARREAMRVQASRALALAPDSDEARLAELKVRIELDRDQAGTVRELQEMVRRSPANLPAWRALGRCLRKQADADGALAALQRAWQLSSNDPIIASDLMNHLTNVGQFAEADRLIRAQVSGNKPVRLLAHDLLMDLYWRGNPRAATDHAARWPPWFLAEDRGAGHAALAALWSRDPGLAQKILARFPRDYLTDYLYTGPRAVLTAWANEQAGNAEAAQADWKIVRQVTERILGELPDDRAALHWKAWALARLGDRPGATAIVRLLEQREEHGNAFFLFGGLAGLKAALGDSEGAVDLLAKVRVDLPLNIKPITKAFLTFNPVFDPLRDNPRFQALIAAAPGPEEKKEAGAASAIPPEKSVAVLAFANLSDDKANEYFSDGISEELLNVLAKVPGLKVSARTSAFYFKGKEVPVPQIARQLGVAYVVEGSVRKAGDKVRITAQLVKAADGFQVWSDTFTRDIRDVFAVQDEIAGLIAQQLQLKLGGAARPAAPINPEAFELYVQARRAWNLRHAAGFAQAEELLTRALMLEPDFARAHVALADVWMLRAIANGVIATFGQRQAPVFVQIGRGIEKALALDPDSSEARASSGLLARLRQWDLPAAEREFRRAIELNPNYATAHHWLGNCLIESGRVDEGVAELRRAAELDPFSLRILESHAQGLVYAGKPGEALAVLGRAEALQARSPLTLFLKAEALLQLGRRAEALAVARELDPEDRAELLARTGEKAEAEAALAEAEGWGRYVLLVALGRTAEAVAALRADDVPGTEIGRWLLDPRLDPFRSDRHFVDLLKTLGLTEAHARAQAWRAAQPAETRGRKAEDGGRK